MSGSCKATCAVSPHGGISGFQRIYENAAKNNWINPPPAWLTKLG